ncbi:putative transcription factor NAM family [Helianthus annuus]|uniref:Putative NAC domain-containing protein n=1 Tax=Helianthus annuus TaxID=4232 RepID=A0A251TAZ4_HELAN|nr:NAC domain-containing protein 53 [Helianthus annuus]KAF5799007.1 putative transcription factor NAM family [Helianthus annuus]KAJ0563479.1 putative transcription factor NAM family [Helianthus annuus]KAJ0728816.1 putative transcription factor NAM family [Helianthus annuus]KAJ0731574.1 putative transcription factor NAM family [Helianthus annuus]KAJ0905097.1 putative transcription factor NAM family [Helianthus annuus]
MAVVLDPIPAVPATASSLAPGFRFHPTDEELVRYYLRRKICGKPFRFDAISDVEVYKVEPWDLPGLSRLKTRDLEWYFFSVLDKKYVNGSRTNRATDRGYWKTTGKDRAVYHRYQLIGMKKTLVYHIGRAPKGERTNWVMHEYRLIDQELEKAGIFQDSFVLCRIFRKSGSGPKNGEQYGAPFVDEEWDDDELTMVPKQDFVESLPVDDAYLDADDIEQILGSDTPEEHRPLQLEIPQGDDVSSGDVSTETVDDPQNLSMCESEGQPQVDQADGPKLFDLPIQNDLDPTSVKHEYITETSNTEDFDVDNYLLDEPYFDASTSDFQVNGSSFLEADDVKNDVKAEPGLDMFDEYPTYLIPPTDGFEYAFDLLGNDNMLENANEGIHQLSEVSKEFFEVHDGDFASTSSQENPDLATGNTEGTHETCDASNQHLEEQGNDLVPSLKQEDSCLPTEFAYPFLHRGSCMPAYASESSAKYMAAASQASTSIRVTTGMIRIRDISFTGSKLDWSFGKNGHLNIVLSFQLEQIEGNSVNSDEALGLTSRKRNSSVPRSLFYCLFLWIVILSLSFKIRSLVCPRSYMS